MGIKTNQKGGLEKMEKENIKENKNEMLELKRLWGFVESGLWGRAAITY